MPRFTRENKPKHLGLMIKGVPRYSQVSRINGSPIIIPKPSVSVRYTKGPIKKYSNKHNHNRVISIQGWNKLSSNSSNSNNNSSNNEVMGLAGKIKNSKKKRRRRKSKSRNK